MNFWVAFGDVIFSLPVLRLLPIVVKEYVEICKILIR